MVRTGDPDEDLRVNLQRVTTQLEELIRIRPGQWAMFLPVWPEGQASS
jgi:lauroyl/myristoyl acyltransferase